MLNLGLKEKEKSISSFLIITKVVVKVLGRYFKDQLKYSMLISYAINYIFENIQYFKRDPHRKKSFIYRIWLFAIVISNICFSCHFLYKDFIEEKEATIKKQHDTQTADDTGYGLLFMVLSGLFCNDNIEHVLFHIYQIIFDKKQFLYLLKEAKKDYRLHQHSKIHKLLYRPPFKIKNDGADTIIVEESFSKNDDGSSSSNTNIELSNINKIKNS